MYSECHDPESVVAALPEGELLLLLVSFTDVDAVPALCAALRARGRRAVGGIFPGLIQGERPLTTGLIAEALPAGFSRALARLDGPLVEWLDPPPAVEDARPATALVFADCNAPALSALLADLFERYANRLTYCGGGTGFPDLRPQPTIFTEAGFLAQGAFVLVGPHKTCVEVRHGWRRLGPAFVATRTTGPLVHEFDWEPAAMFYRRAVALRAPELTDRPFFPDINARFPLAIARAGAEDVIRDPVRETEEGGVLFLSDVPENSVLHLMTAAPDDMIAAAGDAALRLSTDRSPACVLILDCGSRANVLAEHFDRELGAVATTLTRLRGAPACLEGALVLGEIASDGEGRIELYNKTLVLAAFDG
jgi:hypothetical protein